ncbi:hypothetical protein F4680DRAFT_469082 [Xylaria scruposa]|nr:hypothetical protein F4680DRAFT_469082 [Xylaria scruposa]
MDPDKANSSPMIDKSQFGALDKRVRDLRELDDGKHVIHVDVLIVGSGPIGAVYARTLIDYEGHKDPRKSSLPGFKVGRVLMIDMGAQESKKAGDHHKNSIVMQKDPSLFTNVVKGQLSPLSVADPHDILSRNRGHRGASNPQQEPECNLRASAATRVVGGMSTHWTGCTPRQHPLERSKLFNDDEWQSLYSKCEALFNTNEVNFESSVRHRLVKHVLKDKFQKDFERGYKKPQQTRARLVKTMPFAAKQLPGNESYIEWSCTATILGDLANSKPGDTRFMLMSQTQCDVLQINPQSGKVECAIIIDLLHNKEYVVRANRYVICGGAVLTAGIVAKSVLESGRKLDEFCPALGKYMTEQTMTLCQIVLKQDFIDEVKAYPDFLDEPNQSLIKDKVVEYRKNNPDDPIPFSFDDFDPQVYTPFSEEYPWHTQIYRDVFQYVEPPPIVDPRLVVELRFFGLIESREANRITWDINNRDVFGMLQPTFWFQMTDHDKSQAEKMKKDMTRIAELLGDFIPGSEPQDLEPGAALHLCGIYRAGEKPSPDSVVSREGKVWASDNLYLGGCGILSVSNASNPTLTAACHALAGARQIAEELESLRPVRNN